MHAAVCATDIAAQLGGNLTGRRHQWQEPLYNTILTSASSQQCQMAYNGTPWFGAACGQHDS